MNRLLLILLLSVLVGCSTNESNPVTPVTPGASTVTFIELGSDHCEACLLMRPIMVSLAARYGEHQLRVTFIDVMREPLRAEPYGIRVMPTQVFIDRNGVEFHRHEGFYSEDMIDSVLILRGLIPNP